VKLGSTLDETKTDHSYKENASSCRFEICDLLAKSVISGQKSAVRAPIGEHFQGHATAALHFRLIHKRSVFGQETLAFKSDNIAGLPYI